MTEGAGRTAAAVGYVCEHVADIQELLAELGDTSPVERVLAAVRAGEDVTEPLDRLHKILQANGDVLGVYGDPGRSALRPAGVARPAPVEVVFLCPHRRCTRYRWPGAGGTPVCGIDGTPMARERLR
ncbi:hypothetical protein [Actinocrispum sp. NPDC049592]|uniref:hypothetical protein n=1 Tax=Actinocrispum sp. NPDC049592 TaxID=3154835 RepID=UPI0034498072